MDTSRMWIPALVGGVFLGVASAVPVVYYLNCACCALVIGGGLLASFVYLRERPAGMPPAGYGEGAVLGLITGAVGGLVWTFVASAIHWTRARMGLATEEWEEIQEALSDPEIPAALRDLLQGLVDPEGLSVFFVLMTLIVAMTASLVFATLGSILGIALFQRSSGRPTGAATLPPSEPPPAPPASSP